MTSRDYVTVVSGMPRSGTSLMMRMLEAGGLPALTDGKRVADAHNPHGYFEYEPVKRMAQDASWMKEARGKAVKIIYRLLPQIPAGFEYRVIFMERELSEVFASQRDMLRTRGDDAVGQEERRLIDAFKADLQEVRQWIGAQSNIRLMAAPYGGILEDPERWSNDISNFLGGLDVDAMAEAVDPALRHHGNPEGKS